jgi:hypothetical protein
MRLPLLLLLILSLTPRVEAQPANAVEAARKAAEAAIQKSFPGSTVTVEVEGLTQSAGGTGASVTGAGDKVKVVNFYGQSQADDNKARSAKATTTSKGRFFVLADLGGEDYQLNRSIKKAHVLSASDVLKGYGNNVYACADSGASLHIVDEKLITENRKTFGEGTVTWGDGSSTKTVVSGTVSATLIGKDGSKQMIRFPAWGVPQLATPLLSATAFARGGAALHVEKGNSSLDFSKLGGERLRIGDDCMMRFIPSGCKQPNLAKANAATTSPASLKSNRRRPDC